MKTTGTLFALLMLQMTVRGAITVTLSPGVGGTLVSITQTADNPVFSGTNPGYTPVTGYVVAILLARDSLLQSPDTDIAGIFTSSIGTLTKVGGSGTSAVTGMDLFQGFSSGSIPGLVLATPILIEGIQSHQFVFTGGPASEIAVDFTHFIPGTYVESSPIFGQVTTVVIPEPASIFLLGCASLGCLGHRRR